MKASEMLQHILSAPWPLMEYQAWLEKTPPSPADDYLFVQPRIRFEPADNDRLSLLDSATLIEKNGVVSVQISRQRPSIGISSLTMGSAKALYTALRQGPLLVELPFAAQVSKADCDALIRSGFGQFIFASEALARLDQRAAASEVVRFPASPYEIVRSYWQNVGELSSEICASIDTPAEQPSFMTWLRECHVKLLLGVNFDSFYRPSSPIARRRVMPGALYTKQTQYVTTANGVFIVEGPRINASPIGSAAYDRALRSSLQAHDASEVAPYISNIERNWGSIIPARARTDERETPWFIPPRPMSPEHFDLVWEAWHRALVAMNQHDIATAIAQLGIFHWRFVRLHPFACANQSLAFLLVNCVLKQLLGCGIPQLILDHVALRHGCLEYTRIFGRAVKAWQTFTKNDVERQRERIHKRLRLDQFIAALGATRTEEEVERLVNQDPEVAQLALLGSTGAY